MLTEKLPECIQECEFVNWNAIKLLIIDCDGVFTDGRIIYDNHRVEAKNFDAKDGMGIKILHTAGIKIAMITGRDSQVVAQRCLDLKFDFVFQGVWRKLAVADKIRQELNLNWENIAYIGDDWNDYPVMKKVGISAAPADAFEDFRHTADYICQKNGGRGAIREFVETLLKKQGRFDDVLQKLIADLEADSI